MREIIHRRDLALEGVGVDGRDMALEELARLYLEELRSRCVDAHYVNSKSMIERALAGIGVQRVGDLLPLHALKYRAQLLASGAAPRTANLHIDRVSAMLVWGVKVGLLHRNPLERIDRLRDTGGHARYQRRALSADEITRLLDAVGAEDHEQAARAKAEAAGRSPRAVRHRGVRIPQRPLFQALIETGARWRELTLVTWADLDADQALLKLRAANTKSRKARVIPLRRGAGRRVARATPAARRRAWARRECIGSRVPVARGGRLERAHEQRRAHPAPRSRTRRHRAAQRGGGEARPARLAPQRSDPVGAQGRADRARAGAAGAQRCAAHEQGVHARRGRGPARGGRGAWRGR